MPMTFNLLIKFPNILKTFSQINVTFGFLNLICFQFFIIIHNYLCTDSNNFSRINLWAKVQAHFSKYDEDYQSPSEMIFPLLFSEALYPYYHLILSFYSIFVGKI